MKKYNQKMLKEDYEILERLIAEYGEAAVINEMRLPKNIISKVASAGLLATQLLTPSCNITNNTQHPLNKISTQIEKVKPSNPYGMSDSEYALFLDRVDAVRTEIERIFNIQRLDISELGFDIEYLVLLCHEYNYDIPLLLAQARQESQFGTTPRARKFNSLFSVGAWDNGQNRAKYSTQNDAIKDYIISMIEDYLDGGKISVDTLLSDGNFVNYNGHRYASDKGYERRIRSIRNSILRTYPCLSNNINPDDYTDKIS